MNYINNCRTIKFPSTKADLIFNKGLISRAEYLKGTDVITLEDTPYPITKRIFDWTDIEVLNNLTNEWIAISSGNYKALDEAYTDPVKEPIKPVPVVESNTVEYDVRKVADPEPTIETVEESPMEEEVIENEDISEEDVQESDVVENEQEEVNEEVTDNTTPEVKPVQQNNYNQNYHSNNKKRHGNGRR